MGVEAGVHQIRVKSTILLQSPPAAKHMIFVAVGDSVIASASIYSVLTCIATAATIPSGINSNFTHLPPPPLEGWWYLKGGIVSN